MPIYDYRCDHCGHVFSAVRSFTDADVDSCPNCGKHPRKLLTAPAVVFKGGGWYKTDSRGKAPKESDSAGSSDHKAESAPAAKETPAVPKETKTSPKPAGDGGAKSEASS